MRKILPDLTSTHVTGAADVRVQLERIERVIIDPLPPSDNPPTVQ